MRKSTFDDMLSAYREVFRKTIHPNTELRRYELEMLLDHMNSLPCSAVRMAEIREDSACGTVGCALGHATTLPELRALGLTWEKLDGLDDYCLHWQGGSMLSAYAFAGMQLFRLKTRDEASLLFQSPTIPEEDMGAEALVPYQMLDQWGKFMTRAEARQVAAEADQILFRCGGDERELFSENLY